MFKFGASRDLGWSKATNANQQESNNGRNDDFGHAKILVNRCPYNTDAQVR